MKLGGGFTIECSAMHAQGVMERRITRLGAVFELDTSVPSLCDNLGFLPTGNL